MRLIMKKLFQFLFFTFFIFTLTLTTFSCANIIDALKEAFPPPGKSGENIQDENTETEKPNDVVDDEQDKNPETEKPNTDGNHQGSNSGGSDTLKPVESYPYKSTVNFTITGLDEGTYFIEPKFPDPDSSNENIIFKKRAFTQDDKSYTFGIDANELLYIVFDFIDINTKEVIMKHCVELKQEQTLEEVLNIIEFNTTVNVSGAYNNYDNPKLLFQVFPKWDNFPLQKFYDVTTQPINISIKWAEEYAVPYLVIFNDTDNDNDYKNLYFNRDHNNDDYAISNLVHGMREPDNSTEFAFNLEIFDSATLLPSLLDESQFIEIINPAEYNSSDETTKHYRFEKIDSRWTFLIPAGIGSDGEFITCYFCENNLEGHSGYHLWNLLNTIGILHDEEFKNAQRNQTTEWHDYFKQIIAYLQDEKGLTVYNIPDFLQN